MIQMNVKGLAFQQFRSQLIYEFDEERWNNYFEILKESNPFFQQGVIATTNIPLEEYITFLDTMLKEFYKNDEKMYWILGKLSAIYTLSEKGPFHAYIRTKRDPESFISKILHRVWNMYYDEGSVKYQVKENIMHAYILDLPKYHIYFEYNNMGYAEKALGIIGVQVKETIKVKSSAKEIYYKFVLDL